MEVFNGSLELHKENGMNVTNVTNECLCFGMNLEIFFCYFFRLPIFFLFIFVIVIARILSKQLIFEKFFCC